MAVGSGEKVNVQNVNHPGQVKAVDAEKYRAMKGAYLEALPKTEPGLTLDEIRARLISSLPAILFPGGVGAGWWAKTVQLDLEAKGIVVRDRSSPIRLRKVR